METKRRILLVEDEEVLRNAIKKQLESSGYEVMAASDGLQAQNIIAFESFDVVLSDIKMPASHISGIDLLKYIKKEAPTKVALMTGFSELAETKQAYALGADGFLAKPFKKAELLEMFHGFFPDENAKGKMAFGKSVDSDFCKISIDDFLSGREIKFEIYVRLAPNKFVKIAHKGEDLSRSRIEEFKGHSLRYLYLHKDDFKKYLEFNRVIAQAVQAHTNIEPAKKLQLLRHANEVVLEHFHHNEVSPATFDDAKSVLETTLTVLCESDETFTLLDTLGKHSDILYAHSLGVSLYAALVCRQIKWDAPQTLYKVSIAGLFHDIGKKEIDRAIIEKPRGSLTLEEIRLLETHSARGMEILVKIPTITEDILQVVLQHHENCVGSGYPSKLTKSKIQPFARLIAVCDEFCKIAVVSPGEPKVSATAAVERLYLMYAEVLDPTFLNALAEVFGMKPSEICKKHGLRLRVA